MRRHTNLISGAEKQSRRPRTTFPPPGSAWNSARQTSRKERRKSRRKRKLPRPPAAVPLLLLSVPAMRFPSLPAQFRKGTRRLRRWSAAAKASNRPPFHRESDGQDCQRFDQNHGAHHQERHSDGPHNGQDHPGHSESGTEIRPGCRQSHSPAAQAVRVAAQKSSPQQEPQPGPPFPQSGRSLPGQRP